MTYCDACLLKFDFVQKRLRVREEQKYLYLRQSSPGILRTAKMTNSSTEMYVVEQMLSLVNAVIVKLFLSL